MTNYRCSCGKTDCPNWETHINGCDDVDPHAPENDPLYDLDAVDPIAAFTLADMPVRLESFHGTDLFAKLAHRMSGSDILRRPDPTPDTMLLVPFQLAITPLADQRQACSNAGNITDGYAGVAANQVFFSGCPHHAQATVLDRVT